MATAALAPPLAQNTYSKEDETLLVFARLMEGGQEDDETCRDLDNLAALLNQDSAAIANDGTHPSICKVIDVDLVDTMLGYLDLRQSDIVRGRAILTTSAYLSAAGGDGQEKLTTFFRSRIQRGTYDDYIIAFCVAAATFPIVPDLMSRLFLAEGFLSSLGPLMRRTWKSRKVETACLEMLNAACLHAACRDAIEKYCTEWLEEVVDSDPAEVVREVSRETDVQLEGGTVFLRRHSEHVLSMAAIILTKLRIVPKTQSQARLDPTKSGGGGGIGFVDSAITTVEDLSAIFVSALKATGEEEDPVSKQHGIEGLAYATLQPKIKESVARDTVLLQRIVKCLADAPPKSPVTYGALSILVNLTRYRPVVSEEEAKVEQLKAYANAQGNYQPDPLNSDPSVSERCRLVFEAAVLPVLVTHCKDGSPRSLGLVVSIIHALSVTTSLRGKLAQQGALRLLITSWATLPEAEAATRRTASQALARILISTNPALVLGGNRSTPLASAIRPLVYIVPPDETADTRDLLPTFEALMALTNLASVEDADTRRLIISAAWPVVEEQLFCPNAKIARAAVELICNLVQSPEGLVLYADGSPKAKERLHILLALADAEDEGTRSAAGGALAGLTGYEGVVQAVCERKGGIRVILGMCCDDSEDLRHRAAVTTYNIVAAEGEIGRMARQMVKDENGVDRLEECAKKSRRPDVVQIALQALKVLVEGR